MYCLILRFIKYICSQTVSCPSCGVQDFHFTKPLNTFVTRDELAMVRLKKIILGLNEKGDNFDTTYFFRLQRPTRTSQEAGQQLYAHSLISRHKDTQLI